MSFYYTFNNIKFRYTFKSFFLLFMGKIFPNNTLSLPIFLHHEAISQNEVVYSVLCVVTWSTNNLRQTDWLMKGRGRWSLRTSQKVNDKRIEDEEKRVWNGRESHFHFEWRIYLGQFVSRHKLRYATAPRSLPRENLGRLISEEVSRDCSVSFV